MQTTNNDTIKITFLTHAVLYLKLYTRWHKYVRVHNFNKLVIMINIISPYANHQYICFQILF